jgi:hypothetical protein
LNVVDSRLWKADRKTTANPVWRLLPAG